MIKRILLAAALLLSGNLHAVTISGKPTAYTFNGAWTGANSTPAPTSYYHFDEGSGTALADIGTDGSYDISSFTGTPDWQTCGGVDCLNFDGSTEWIDIAGGWGTAQSTTDLTICAIHIADAHGAQDSTIVGVGNTSSSNDDYLQMGNNTAPKYNAQYRLNGTITSDIASSARDDSGTAKFHCLVWDQSAKNAVVYEENGSTIGVSATPATIGAFTNDVGRIAGTPESGTPSEIFDGKIVALYVWKSTALSAAQVQDVYNSDDPWPFLTPSGSCPATCAGGRSARCITDISDASDPDNLLYGLSPAAVAHEDTVCYDATSVLGDTVNVSAAGWPSIASGGSQLTDSFDYCVMDNGDPCGTDGTYEVTFQPVITSVTGIGTGQTTADITVTPAGPTEGTVRGVAISKTSYDTYGAPSHAQIAAGVDGNNANVAWGSEFTKSFQTSAGQGWTFARSSTQVGASENGDFFSAASGYPMLMGASEYIGTIYGDSLANDLNDIGGSVQNNGLVDYTLRRQATGGYTLSQIKTVFDGDFPYSGDNFVILEGGINDIVSAGSDPNTAMRSDMAAMADDVIAAGKHLVIVNLMPWKSHANWTSTRQTYTDSYNAWLLATYPEYVFDAASVVEDPATADTLLAAYDSGDGLHPNGTGFAAINAALADEFPKTAGTGILLEPASANLLGYDSDLVAGWTKTRSTVNGDALAALDRTTTADKIVEDGTASNDHLVQRPVTKAASALQYTASMYFKAAERTHVTVTAFGASFSHRASVTFNLSSPSIHSAASASGDFSGASATFESLSNGWVRGTLTFTTDLATTLTLRISLHNGTSTVYNGDGASGLYAWGGQVEPGGNATSYIPAPTVAVSREATSLSRSWNTPTNTFSGYAVVTAHVPSTYTATAQPIITYYKDANNWLKVTHPTTSGRMDLDLSIGGTTASAQVTGLTWAIGDQLDIRWRKNASGIKLWVEASSTETTTGVAPDPFTTPPDTIRLGRSEASVYGHWTVESLKVWNSVDDTALGALN